MKPFKRKRRVPLFVCQIIAVVIFSMLIGVSFGHKSSYILDTNCCRHMAENIEDQLESKGIDVIIVIGKNEAGNESHAWVSIFGIEFDSVSLLPYLCDEFNPYRFNKTFYNDYSDKVKNNEIQVMEQIISITAKNSGDDR